MKLVLGLLLFCICQVLTYGFSLPLPSIIVSNKRSIEMRERKCDLTGRRKNSKCMNVSNSGARTHREQGINLQERRFWWEEGNKFVRLRIAAKTLRTIKKHGLNKTAKLYGVNLNSFAISSGTGVTLPQMPGRI